MTDLRAYQLRIDRLLHEGYTVEQILGFIYGLYADYIIDEDIEGPLYDYVDPEDTHNDKAPAEYWRDWYGDNPLIVFKE